MKIYDMHIHSFDHTPAPEVLLSEMEKAGVYGGCVFSNWPKEANPAVGTSFEERLEEVLAWTRGYEDRLFPVLWIHPYEEDIINKVHVAVEAGVAAFKMICTNFYVYEEKSMALLREIASLDKPVIFHTGILWDGAVSSNYNRPLNWEALLGIEGLRFSMGHCSWPWIDECIALYGKFLNSLTVRNTAEMFFDITPGTPEIYRRELMTKLFEIGYDVGHNIMFGTDSLANGYKSEWSGKWLATDGAIMDELGVSRQYRELMYYGNLMRFLGKTKERPAIASPEVDDSHAWSAVNPEVAKIIDKWYLKLGFPKEYNREFYRALDTIRVSDAVTVKSFGEGTDNGARNLLTFLFLCEEVSEKYKAAGISEEILIDTLYDIVRWTDTYTEIHGKLYLGELGWLGRHMSMNLFKLGRLQFAMGGSEADVPKYGLKKGDPVIEVHIPAGEKLDIAECKKSLDAAREFFAKYFPEYKWEYFTCHSWLLDPSIRQLMNGGNILAFQDMFDIIENQDSAAVLRYVFKWNTNMMNLRNAVCVGSFAEKLKKYALAGGELHESFGVIVK